MADSSLLTLSVVLNGGDRVLPLPPLAPTIDVGTIKMIIGSETNLPDTSIVLLYKQVVLTDGQTLGAIGIKNDEILEARAGPQRPANAGNTAQRAPQQQPASQPATNNGAMRSTNSLGIPDAIMADPARVREFIRATPELLHTIAAQNAALYEAILLNDITPFTRMWAAIRANMDAAREREREQFRLANSDPFDIEAQRRIEEEIRLKNVEENYEMAIEHAPEVFGRVVMLYIPMSVNGHKLQAFVDSGAQSTIMSVQCAERCGIMRLVDKRFAGMAKGVGSAPIIGRVHAVPVKLGDFHTTMSFTILDNQDDMSFLLGLDQLKNHQACIDLAKNALCLHGQEIKFLSEGELEKDKKDAPDAEMSPPAAAAGSSSSSSSSTAPKPASVPSGAAAAAAAASASVATPKPAAVAAAAAGSSTPSSTSASQAAPAGQSAAAAAAVAAAQRRAAAATNPPAAATSTAPAPAAQPTVTPQPTTTSTPAPTTGGAPSAAAIAQLTDLGFSHSESVAALTRFAGNVDAAASYLFSL